LSTPSCRSPTTSTPLLHPYPFPKPPQPHDRRTLEPSSATDRVATAIARPARCRSSSPQFQSSRRHQRTRGGSNTPPKACSGKFRRGTAAICRRRHPLFLQGPDCIFFNLPRVFIVNQWYICDF
jgi:hypothetical protein